MTCLSQKHQNYTQPDPCRPGFFFTPYRGDRYEIKIPILNKPKYLIKKHYFFNFINIINKKIGEGRSRAFYNSSHYILKTRKCLLHVNRVENRLRYRLIMNKADERIQNSWHLTKNREIVDWDEAYTVFEKKRHCWPLNFKQPAELLGSKKLTMLRLSLLYKSAAAFNIQSQ